MEKYRVRITAGNHINHFWTVEADSRSEAIKKVIDSFDVYGKPYDIEKDGIIFIDSYLLKEVTL